MRKDIYDGEITGVLPSEINITPMDETVYNLISGIEVEEIELATHEWKKELWDDVQQSRLLESIMLRIPIPAFYFDMTKVTKWKVIDGYQRLRTLKNYLLGETIQNGMSLKNINTVEKKKLKGLQYLTKFNGLTVDELPRQYYRRILESPVEVYGVQKGTPEKALFNIYQRIRTGQAHVSDQEIRHTIYYGKTTKLASELMNNLDFRIMAHDSIKVDHPLEDEEQIIRYIAFLDLDAKRDYQTDLNSFLIQAMVKVNEYDEEELKRSSDLFSRSMSNVRNILGEHAFRKVKEDGNTPDRFNKALFDLTAVSFSRMSDEELAVLQERRSLFLERYCELLSNRDFKRMLNSDSPKNVLGRMRCWKNMLEELL